MAKKKLVAKIEAETGVSQEDLNRLPVEALEILDGLKDDDLLGNGSPNSTEESAPNGTKRLLGYHPITGKEVWN